MEDRSVFGSWRIICSGSCRYRLIFESSFSDNDTGLI